MQQPHTASPSTTIHEFASTDDPRFAEAVAVYNALQENFHTSVAELAHWRELHPRGWRAACAIIDGKVVGFADSNWRTWNPGAPYVLSEIGVAPDHRGRGVGSALWAWASSTARDHGAGDQLDVYGPASEETVSWWARRGYEAVERHKYVELVIEGRSFPAPSPPAGVRIGSWAEDERLIASTWRMMADTISDVPSASPIEHMPEEQWIATLTQHPDYRPEANIVAIEGDEVIGWAGLLASSAQPDVVWHEMTGVHPTARGRGVAQALKLAAIAWAAGAGRTRLRTDNGERNAPMRHINRKLGYEPPPEQVTLCGPLAP